MKKFLLSLALLILLPISLGIASERSKKLEKAVVYIESLDGKCSGFISDSAYKTDKGEDKDLVITAAHCDGKELTVDGQPAKVKAKFQREDLLVLEVDDTGKPALKLAMKNPDVEQHVTSVGFGYALEKPLVRQANISQVDLRMPEAEFQSEYIALDAPFVGGQSGGPVVDQESNVVMIVQFGSSTVGFGVGAETIKKKVGKYFERPIK